MDFDIVGEWPDISGRMLEELVVREFWLEGDLIDRACVIWLKAGADWYALCFEPGTIFWRRNWEVPLPLHFEVGDSDFHYPKRDVGVLSGSRQHRILSCSGTSDDISTNVSIVLENFGVLVFKHPHELETTFVSVRRRQA